MTTESGAAALHQRLAAVRDAVRTAEIDAILLTEIVNIAYLSGFSGSTAYVVVGANVAALVTDSRYMLRARAECPHFDVPIIPTGASWLDTVKEQLQKADRRAGSAGPARVGFEAGRVTVSQFEHFKKDAADFEWLPTENIVENLRAIKDDSEVGRIRVAVDLAEQAFLSVKHLLRPGIRERDFAVELEFAMRRSGADAAAFETIVASGPQSAHPHHRPNDRVLAVGDFVTVDWGANLENYCSDLTRTFFLGRAADLTDEHRKVYDTVLKAQRAGIAAIAPEKNGKDVDAVARDLIAAAGYGENFGHSLGHALGRVVHDGPGLSPRAGDNILKPGMVVTVEPGIYVENFGGVRIEEDVVVTQAGCEVLTHLPNELECLSN